MPSNSALLHPVRLQFCLQNDNHDLFKNGLPIQRLYAGHQSHIRLERNLVNFLVRATIAGRIHKLANDLMFPRPDGTPWPPDSFSTAFAAFIRDAKLPHVRLHDLRHSHATQLLLQSVHPKVVSERLGHSKIGIALDTYSRVLPGMQEDAAALINGYIGKALLDQKTGD